MQTLDAIYFKTLKYHKATYKKENFYVNLCGEVYILKISRTEQQYFDLKKNVPFSPSTGRENDENKKLLIKKMMKRAQNSLN